ncbi:hypothetical protein NX059_000536 [Plenodomus lindquistii]|nr:hypothetical protein NX059_000536 [Plenodomus lindquistii]
MGETERNDSLISANAALKSALIRARQHFLTIETAMQSLNDALSTALNLPPTPANGAEHCPQSGQPMSSKSAPPTSSLYEPDSNEYHSASLNTEDANAMHVDSSDDGVYNIEENTDNCLTMNASKMDAAASSNNLEITPSNLVAIHESGQPCSVGDDIGNQLGVVSEPGSVPSLLSSSECGDQLSLASFSYFNELLGNSDFSFQNLSNNSLLPSIDPSLYSPSMLYQPLPPFSVSHASPHNRILSSGLQSSGSLFGCVEALETSLKRHLDSMGQTTEDFLGKAHLLLMIYFAKYVWPGPSVMWFSSSIYAMTERSFAWRMSQSKGRLPKLPTYLSPTQLQARMPHHAPISWITIPSLRDRILEHYSAGISFDEIWLDLMDHSVIEVEDISSILTGVSQERGFLGVMNIYAAICLQGSSSSPDVFANDAKKMFQELAEIDTLGLLRIYRMGLASSPATCCSPAEKRGTWTPVPIDRLLASPILARKLYYHLELYKSDSCWRIDPAFFKKYPALKWAGHEQYVARGISFRRDPGLISTPPRATQDQLVSQFELALMTLDPNVDI